MKLELDGNISAGELYYIANHPDLETMFDDEPPTIQQVRNALATPGVGVCLCKYGSLVVGFIALKVHDKHVYEISGGFIDGYRGKIAKDVVARFITLLFKGGAVKIVAEVLPDNKRCLAMAYSLGFKRVDWDQVRNRIYLSLDIGDWKYGPSIRQ